MKRLNIWCIYIALRASYRIIYPLLLRSECRIPRRWLMPTGLQSCSASVSATVLDWSHYVLRLIFEIILADLFWKHVVYSRIKQQWQLASCTTSDHVDGVVIGIQTLQLLSNSVGCQLYSLCLGVSGFYNGLSQDGAGSTHFGDQVAVCSYILTKYIHFGI